MVSSIALLSYTLRSSRSTDYLPVPSGTRQPQDSVQTISHKASNETTRQEQRKSPEPAVFPFALEFLLDKTKFLHRQESLSAYRLQERQILYTPTLPANVTPAVEAGNDPGAQSQNMKATAIRLYRSQIEMVPYRQGILVDIYA